MRALVPWNRSSARISLALATAGGVGPPSNTQSIRAAARLAIGRDHFATSARNFCSRGLAAALLFAAVAAPSFATPAAKARTESWFEFFFHSKKVGFLYALDEPTTVEGRAAVHSLRRSVLVVRRADQVIHMESETDAWSELDGNPIRFKHVRTEGGARRTLEGTREGAVFAVRVDVGGTLTEKKHPLVKGTRYILSSAMDAFFKRDLAVGKKEVGQAILEEDGDVRPYTVEVKGKEGDLFIVQSEVAGIVSKELVTAAGLTTRTTVERLGAEFIGTTRDKALAAVDPTDIFGAAHLRTGVRLPKTERIDALTVRLRGKSGRPPKPITDARHKVTDKAKDSVVLVVKAEEVPPKSPKLGVLPKDPEGVKFLVETPYEQIKDERLQSAAKKAIGDATDTWTAAKRLNAFVHSNITKKSLAQAFSTAIEALEAKEGDCTEHAVLMSALAKTVGIPARLVTGLVYVGGEEGIFGYHEWVELRIGDRWVAMDPTFGQDLADVSHVKFSQGLSDADGLREAGIAAAELFGDLELTVLEYVEIGGKKTRP